jgi:hypothetical protein
MIGLFRPSRRPTVDETPFGLSSNDSELKKALLFYTFCLCHSVFAFDVLTLGSIR